MRRVCAIVLALATAVPAFAENVVLLNGIIVDGTGKPRVVGDVRIRDGKIVDIGQIKPLAGEATIDVQGLVVAPGFVDIENHSLADVGDKPEATTEILQGVTTIALGSGGAGPTEVEKFMKPFDAKPPAVNILTFVGHGGIRRMVMGEDYKRAATPAEIQRMADLVNKAMSQGAFGMSSGLDHDPGAYAAEDELVALAKVVAKFGGVYVTQMRDEGDHVMESIRESIDVGRKAKVPVHISHLRLTTDSAWGKTGQILAEFDKAHAEGIDVTADVYPYDSFLEDMSKLSPDGKFDDPEKVSEMLARVGGANSITILSEPRHPDYAFQTLADLAKEKNMSATALIAEIMKDGGADIACSSISPRDVRAFIHSRWTMIASDGGLNVPHPRSGGTFPRILAEFLKGEQPLTLESAIQKMTSAPAARIGIKDRGVLRKAAFADIVVFDMESIGDTATLQDPFAAPVGVKYVFVNGTMVVKDGQATGQKPGMALR